MENQIHYGNTSVRCFPASVSTAGLYLLSIITCFQAGPVTTNGLTLLVMVLFLTARDQNFQIRNFSCQLDKLEVAFEFLTDIVAKGSTLLQAYIVDEGKRTELPLTIFDGGPFLAAMQELEREWQTLLTEPVLSTPPPESLLIPLIQRRARQYEKKIASYEKLICRLEQLLVRTQKNFSTGPLKSRVISQYESMISQNQVWLIKAQISHQIILNRLSHLSA